MFSPIDMSNLFEGSVAKCISCKLYNEVHCMMCENNQARKSINHDHSFIHNGVGKPSIELTSAYYDCEGLEDDEEMPDEHHLKAYRFFTDGV